MTLVVDIILHTHILMYKLYFYDFFERLELHSSHSISVSVEKTWTYNLYYLIKNDILVNNYKINV